jgi:hypothetical protein
MRRSGKDMFTHEDPGHRRLRRRVRRRQNQYLKPLGHGFRKDTSRVRVLYISNGERPDFLQDILFDGLVRLLGAENIVDWPRNVRYHGSPPDPTIPFLYADVPEHEDTPLDELLARVDGVVIASLRPPVREAVRHVLVARGALPTAFVDGEDDPYVRGIVEEVDVYFKRETLLRRPRSLAAARSLRNLRYAVRGDETLWRDALTRRVAIAAVGDERIVPLPFAAVVRGPAPPRGDEYDVVFLSMASSGVRAQVVRDLQALERDGFRVALRATGYHDHLSWPEYIRLLASSRIGVSVRGAGFDTYRYWEVPYAGALLLAEPPQIELPENFEDGVEAVFAPPEELAERARELLRGETEEIAQAGQRALLARHTSVERARRVIERLQAVSG